MRLSDKYPVPPDLALLYEFVNSLDLRQYVEKVPPHAIGDELATPRQLENWLRARRMLDKGVRLHAEDHRNALELRQALRSFLALDPADRADETSVAAHMDAAASHFPLILKVTESGVVGLRPAPGAGALGLVLAELQLLSQTSRLDRLRMCASDECNWMFFDRSKPGNRRWCSSTRCGNRQKTRAYRQRQREDTHLDSGEP
jgi:predicted RNA-binding Zn ribbon-like protein